jgi:hypothetical protein
MLKQGVCEEDLDVPEACIVLLQGFGSLLRIAQPPPNDLRDDTDNRQSCNCLQQSICAYAVAMRASVYISNFIIEAPVSMHFYVAVNHAEWHNCLSSEPLSLTSALASRVSAERASLSSASCLTSMSSTCGVSVQKQAQKL